MSQEYSEVPMICDCLRSMNDSGLLTAKQLCPIFDVSISGVYRYYSGETQPTWGKIRSLLHQTKRVEVARLLLDDLIAGTGWIAQYIPTESDADGDGDIDLGDVMADAIKSAQATAKLLAETHRAEGTGMRRVDADTGQVLQAQVQSAIRDLVAASRVINHLTLKPTRHLVGT